MKSTERIFGLEWSGGESLIENEISAQQNDK